MPNDEYFDKTGSRPLIDQTAVKWICGTTLLLVLITIAAYVAWNRPDYAARAIAALYEDIKYVIGTILLLAVGLFLLICAGGAGSGGK